MEVLGVLEKKVLQLIEAVTFLHNEVVQLRQERAQLRAQLEAMEHSLLRSGEAEERNKELAHVKASVDEMIHAIDALVAQELLAESPAESRS